MSQLGIGAMLSLLGGNKEYAEVFQRSQGKVISGLRLGKEDEGLQFEFEDGTKMRLYDDGQSCCEHRYMSGDGTDLESYVGAKLVSAEVMEAPSIDDPHGEEHEVAFLHVRTSKGTFTISSHNEHNGYYGGISIRATDS